MEKPYELWNNIKINNICNIRVPEGEEGKKRAENLFIKTMAENVSNQGRDLNIKVQGTNMSPQEV